MLGTIPKIMIFFIAVVTGDSKNVFLKFPGPKFCIDCITFNSKDIKIGVFSFLFFFYLSLFLLFLSLIRGFSIFSLVKMREIIFIQNLRFLSLRLRFLDLKIFGIAGLV